MLKRLADILRKPSAEEIAQRELSDARRALLQAQAAQEYAASMVGYHLARISRLDSFVKGGAK